LVSPSGEFVRQDSLALDKNNHPHICFKSKSRELGYLNVIYAYWNGKKWTLQKVSGEGHEGNCSIQLDSSDQPHLSFGRTVRSDFYIYYAIRQSNNWVLEIVDFTPESFGWLKLNLDSSDQPHVVYTKTDDTNHVFYAHKTKKGWSTKKIYTSKESVFSPQIVVDQTKQIHVSFNKSTTGIYYLKGPLTTTPQSTTD